MNWPTNDLNWRKFFPLQVFYIQLVFYFLITNYIFFMFQGWFYHHRSCGRENEDTECQRWAWSNFWTVCGQLDHRIYRSNNLWTPPNLLYCNVYCIIIELHLNYNLYINLSFNKYVCVYIFFSLQISSQAAAASTCWEKLQEKLIFLDKN